MCKMTPKCLLNVSWKEQEERCVRSGLESMIGSAAVAFLPPDKISLQFPTTYLLSSLVFDLHFISSRFTHPQCEGSQRHSSSSVMQLGQMFSAARHFLQQ